MLDGFCTHNLMVKYLKSVLERNVNFQKYFTQVTTRIQIYLKCTRECIFVGTGICYSAARTVELEPITNYQTKLYNTIVDNIAHPRKYINVRLLSSDLKTSHSLA